MHLQRADGGNHHDRIRGEACHTAFDIEEFLGAEIGAEARFGNGVVTHFEREARCHD